MEITDVRIKLIGEPNDRLKAVCSITLDGVFVVRDLKVVDGTQGLFVAMPSRKLTAHCQRCNSKNHLRARFCNDCGSKLPPPRVPTEGNGRTKLHRDIAHPITTEFRELIQARVIAAFHKELDLSKQPGYMPRDIDETEEAAEPATPTPIEDEPSEYDALIASLRGRDAVPPDNFSSGAPPREGGYREGGRREGGRREGSAPRDGNRRDGGRGGRDGGRDRGRDSGRGGRGSREGSRSGSRPPAETGGGNRGLEENRNRGTSDGGNRGYPPAGNRGDSGVPGFAEADNRGYSEGDGVATSQEGGFGEMPPKPAPRPAPARSESPPPRVTERREAPARPAPPPPPPVRQAPPPPPAPEETDEPFGAGIL